MEIRQLNPLPLGRNMLYTPPDTCDSDTSAVDNESKELKGRCLPAPYGPPLHEDTMKVHQPRSSTLDMGQQQYYFTEFPKKIGNLPECKETPMSYSLIKDYGAEEDRI